MTIRHSNANPHETPTVSSQAQTLPLLPTKSASSPRIILQADQGDGMITAVPLPVPILESPAVDAPPSRGCAVSESDSDAGNRRPMPGVPDIVSATVYKASIATKAGIGFAPGTPRAGDGGRGVRISSVAPGGLFSGTDLRVDDEIIAINGKINVENHSDAANLVRLAAWEVDVVAARGSRDPDVFVAAVYKAAIKTPAGIVFATNDGARVRRLAPGGLFEQTDIRPGDTVLSVNGVPVDTATQAATLVRTALGVVTVAVRRYEPVPSRRELKAPTAENSGRRPEKKKKRGGGSGCLRCTAGVACILLAPAIVLLFLAGGGGDVSGDCGDCASADDDCCDCAADCYGIRGDNRRSSTKEKEPDGAVQKNL